MHFPRKTTNAQNESSETARGLIEEIKRTLPKRAPSAATVLFVGAISLSLELYLSLLAPILVSSILERFVACISHRGGVTPKFTYILRNFYENRLTVNFVTGDEWSDIFGTREQQQV